MTGLIERPLRDEGIDTLKLLSLQYGRVTIQ
jgi:hypothetical protein